MVGEQLDLDDKTSGSSCRQRRADRSKVSAPPPRPLHADRSTKAQNVRLSFVEAPINVASAYHIVDGVRSADAIAPPTQQLLDKAQSVALQQIKKKDNHKEFFITRLIFVEDMGLLRQALKGMNRLCSIAY